MLETHCFEAQAMCFKYLGIGLNLIRHMIEGGAVDNAQLGEKQVEASKARAASASVEIWSLQGRVVQL